MSWWTKYFTVRSTTIAADNFIVLRLRFKSTFKVCTLIKTHCIILKATKTAHLAITLLNFVLRFSLTNIQE